jgi:hypothetical protein
LGVQRSTKGRYLGFFEPVLRGIGFFGTMVYNVVFRWWLDPWYRRKANGRLLDDVTANLYFLISDPQAGASQHLGAM